MSDDRFKEARRSLIDRQDQEEGDDAGDEDDDGVGDDEFADAKTVLVDLDEDDERGDVGPDEATRKVDRSDLPTGERDRPHSEHSTGGNVVDPPEEETDELPPSKQGGVRQSKRNTPGSRSGVDDESIEERRTRRQPAVGNDDRSGQRDAGERGDASRSGARNRPGDGPAQSGRQQVFVPGDDQGSFDEETAFVDIDQFADEKSDSARLAPDESRAGYEGSTQYVDINSLMGSEDANKSGAPDQIDVLDDQMLRRSYDFGPEDVDRGAINLVYAYNAAGKPVVLRQVWSGDSDEMPSEMRQRINRIDALEAPNLISLNGMLVTETGAWLELNCPEGRRMSDILEVEGAQKPERVIRWVEAVGETLEAIHEHGLVYANLTPDAIWIEEDGSIVLEPFDLMCLKDRGDLGQFGPPELDDDPDERQLSPATDVYSLAAVMLAGLTGIPLRPERVAAIESDQITEAVRDAVIDDPDERLQSISTFLEALDGGGFPSVGDLSIGLNVRTAIVVLFVLTLAAGGVLAYQKMGGSLNIAGGERSGGPGATPSTEQNRPAAGSPPTQSANQKPPEPKADPPGPVDKDPRLVTIATSFQFNPPGEAKKGRTAPKEKLESLRKEARSGLEKATSLDEDDAERRRELLEEAIQSATELLRLQTTPSDADRELAADLRDEEAIRELQSELVSRVQDNLEAGSFSDAKMAYRQLSAIENDANSMSFFGHVDAPEVTTISRDGADDGESKSEEGEQ